MCEADAKLAVDFSPVEGVISQLADCPACGWSRCCVVCAASAVDAIEGIVTN